MQALTYPKMEPEAHIKHRLLTLEDATETQYKMNEVIYDALGSLSVDMAQSEVLLRRILIDLQENFSKELSALRQEFEHR